MHGDLIGSLLAVIVMGFIVALVKFSGAGVERIVKWQRGKRYPINRPQMPMGRLSIGDTVTLDEVGDCEYHGFYDGCHLFAPKDGKLENGESYVKLHRKDADRISRVSNDRIGLKFVRCAAKIAD